MNKQDGKIFKFSDPRQKRIYESLKQFVAEAPAAFYKDACKIIDESSNLETKTNLLSHLLREIFGWILDYMLPAVDYDEPKEKDGNHKIKIKDAARFYKIDESEYIFQAWLKVVTGRNGLHKKAHRDSMGELHPLKEFLETWKTSEEVFVFLLDKIASNYLTYTKQLDHFLNKKNITKSDLSKIKTHIPLNQTTLTYFFDHLETLDCLSALKTKGFFKFPKKPLIHDDGGISFPYWSPMTYLIKMSKISKKQDEVVAICLEVETDNVNIQTQILEIAMNLPADKSVQIVKNSYSWFVQMSSWFHPEKYGKLTVHLVKSKFLKEALELARKILEVKANPRKPAEIEGYRFPHDPVALFDEWQYEKILEEDFPTLVDIVGIEAIKILFDQIENYINLSGVDRKKGSKDDYSEIWRPAIEDHTQNHKFGVRDVLITGARDACERLLEAQPEKILEVVSELEKRNLNIFSRLSMHLLRLYPTGAEKKIVEIILDEKEIKERERLTHEYFLLAETHAELLDKKQRENIWSWIMNGADVPAYIKWRKQIDPNPPSEDQKQKYVINWQLYRLLPFKHIDTRWEKYCNDLIAVVGEPEFPSFRSWSRGGSWGPTSIVSNEQLKEMPPLEVIEYLKKWEPDPNDPLDRSREGTSRELISQISNDPTKWIESVPKFIDLDPTYTRAVFVGYRDAVKQGKKFEWEPVLDLGLVVLDKPIEVSDRKKVTPFGDDPDWKWCRNTIVELITEGLKENAGQVSVELKDKLWKVIRVLSEDADPTPAREEEYLKSHPDPLSLAINTTRGDAMDAAIQYGVWLKSALNKKDQPEWTLSKYAPELLEVLNNHLDISKDPSVGIRALYGEKLGVLTWLDGKWVQESHPLIFPADPKLQKYFNSAWNTYITFVQPFNNLFEIIKSQYIRAIKELGNHTDNNHRLENSEQNLAHHLIIFYWRGLIDFDSGLLADFYKVASTELKAEVIDFIGRVGKDDKEVPQGVKDKFVALLEKRIAKVKTFENSQDSIQEFQSLSWWLASEKFDDEWMLNKLLEVLELGCDLEGDHLVMERFIAIANKFPLLVIRCSRLLVENDKKRWGIIHWQDDLKSVIDTVLKSGNDEAKAEAVEFVHRLAARGHLEFKDLLQNINTIESNKLI